MHLRHDITEADGAHGDEDKVEALEEAPGLPDVEDSGSTQDVDEENEDGDGDGEVELIVDSVGGECRGAGWVPGGEVRAQGWLCGWVVEVGWQVFQRHPRGQLRGSPERRDIVHHLHPFHHLLQPCHTKLLFNKNPLFFDIPVCVPFIFYLFCPFSLWH